MRRFAPFPHRVVQRHPLLVQQAVDVGDQHHAVQHRDADQRDEADGRGTDRNSPESHSATTPPMAAKGTLQNTSAACRTEPKVK
jgi:hypothetical protein